MLRSSELDDAVELGPEEPLPAQEVAVPAQEMNDEWMENSYKLTAHLLTSACRFSWSWLFHVV